MMATYTPRPGSKIEKIISFMHANADKDMDMVCAGMLEFVQTNMADCRSYYRWAVKQGIAPGAVAAGRAKSVVKPIIAKPVVVAKTKEVRPETLLPESEVEKIKAANLARLKSVSARVNKLRGDTVVPVAMSEDEYDTFSVPAFLRKDELKVLI
jgi:hypothetical protein